MIENNLINITNSILKHYHVKPHHKTLPLLDRVLKRNYKHVIVILLDGFGMNIIHKLNEDSFLRKNVKKALSSVFPPTTVAATNAFLSGKTPLETGFVGWAQYNPFDDVTDTVFLKCDYYGTHPIERPLYDELQYKNFLEQIKEVDPTLKVEAIFPKPILGSTYETFEEQLDRLIMITKGDRSLSYCYYSEPDATIHGDGVGGLKTKEVIETLSQTIETFASQLNDDVLTLIIADHGLVDIDYLYLEDYPEIIKTFSRLPSIEPRAKTFFISPDKRDVFTALFNTHFQPGFKLLTKEEVYHSNLLGMGKKHPLLDHFIGDYMAISTSKKAIGFMKENDPFKAHHAGMCEDELMIPLIILT